jgi:ABC-type multidrug transport system permease subunit
MMDNSEIFIRAFLLILGVIFVFLKLINVITWGWIAVLIPLMIFFGIFLIDTDWF